MRESTYNYLYYVAIKELLDIAIKELLYIAIMELLDIAIKELLYIAIKELLYTAKELLYIAIKELLTVLVSYYHYKRLEYAVWFRFTTTLACLMDLHNYPLDVQNCSMEIESCEYVCVCGRQSVNKHDTDDGASARNGSRANGGLRTRQCVLRYTVSHAKSFE